MVALGRPASGLHGVVQHSSRVITSSNTKARVRAWGRPAWPPPSACAHGPSDQSTTLGGATHEQQQQMGGCCCKRINAHTGGDAPGGDEYTRRTAQQDAGGGSMRGAGMESTGGGGLRAVHAPPRPRPHATQQVLRFKCTLISSVGRHRPPLGSPQAAAARCSHVQPLEGTTRPGAPGAGSHAKWGTRLSRQPIGAWRLAASPPMALPCTCLWLCRGQP